METHVAPGWRAPRSSAPHVLLVLRVEHIDAHELAARQGGHEARHDRLDGSNLPGQVSRLCGQEIQVAWCGAHSAGIA